MKRTVDVHFTIELDEDVWRHHFQDRRRMQDPTDETVRGLCADAIMDSVPGEVKVYPR